MMYYTYDFFFICDLCVIIFMLLHSQSQTLDKVLLDSTSEPFAHGHLYVACSRVQDCRNIMMFLNIDQLHETGRGEEMMPCVTNIVYRDILLDPSFGDNDCDL